MKESKAMMKKEVAFMKKKGAPKSMLKHEMEEAGVKKMRMGGMGSEPRRPEPIAPRERITRDRPMRGGRFFKEGGSVKSASKRADGVASKGKTKGKIIKMAYGGKC